MSDPLTKNVDRWRKLFGSNRLSIILRSSILCVAVGTVVLMMIGLLWPVSSDTSLSVNRQGVKVGLQVGNAAPNFTVSLLDGKRVSLSDYRGQPVMLNFWYVNCPGCQAEIPDIQHFYSQQLKDGKHPVILGVNTLDDAVTARQFMQQQRLTYPLALDEQSRVAALYNLRGTPTSYFIDAQGIIRLTVLGPVSLDVLQQNLKAYKAIVRNSHRS